MQGGSTVLFGQPVGDTIFFGDGRFFTANIENCKAQQLIQDYSGHDTFDNQAAALTFPKYRRAELPFGLNIKVRVSACEFGRPLIGIAALGKYLPDS